MESTVLLSHILLVDDDREICDLLHRYLEPYGYRTIVARNGQSARRALRESRIDLVILDVMMPGEDGLRCAARCA